MSGDFEAERAQRMAENMRKLESLGVLRQASILESFRTVKGPVAGGVTKAKPNPIARKPKGPRVVRRSARLAGDNSEVIEGVKPTYRELDSDDEEGLINLLGPDAVRASDGAVAGPSSQEEAKVDEQWRCASQGRGSVYDSAVGITCHFCRQKKLCGEENCPRCQRRDSSKECIGKTQCTRCHSATGTFCRACLLIRYGQTMEEARADTEWLCPHCYEAEHPDAGWICNSSICMKRRGLCPTGIAIYQAQSMGFKSVGHYVQAQILRREQVKKDATKSAAADKADNDNATTSSQVSGEQAAAGASQSQPEMPATQDHVLEACTSAGGEEAPAESGHGRMTRRSQATANGKPSVAETAPTKAAAAVKPGPVAQQQPVAKAVAAALAAPAGRVTRSRVATGRC